LLPGAADIAGAVAGALAAPHRAGSPGRAAYDAATPQASSVIELEMGGRDLQGLVEAIAATCRRHPACSATFDWRGITEHPEPIVDLDLGPLAPPSGRGTITLVAYGAGTSHLGLPAVRPGQTAALRLGSPRGARRYLALSVDHRAVDGAEAGRFLADLKEAFQADA
ncbi:MAG: 2-oxo acid dehydrogenase subunit E2, partial [Candidatus Dormibacteraceae bacterium]